VLETPVFIMASKPCMSVPVFKQERQRSRTVKILTNCTLYSSWLL